MFNEVKLPGRYHGATLASFEVGKGQGPSFVAANTYVKQFSKHEENRGLILTGQVGRGKTHLMIGILKELVLRYGVTARFVEFSHLLADLKVSFDRRHGAADILQPLSKVQVLAIDELGKGRNTAFEGTILDEIVSRRYNAGSTILATTNFQPGPSSGQATSNLATPGLDAPRLVDRVGDRVYSRLREVCDFIPVKGEDYRELSRRNRRPNR
jgi:DNA replication protein DnaC